MKLNQKLVERAIIVLSEWQPKYGEKGFPKEMKGDIASFGASIVQAGLLPSVLFFSEGKWDKNPHKIGEKKANEDDNTKQRRANIMQMIFEVMENKTEDDNQNRPLFNLVRKNIQNNEQETLENITEAALALKLAFRAFKFDDKSAKTSSNSETSNP